MPSRILVVDDEADTRWLLRSFLESEGYEILEATNGEEALDRLATHAPDLILLDISMPLIDGYETCQRIRELGIRTPVIMLTGKTQVEHRVKGLDCGADDYLGKPFSLSEISARVRAHLRKVEEVRVHAEEILRGRWEEINEGLSLIERIQQPHSLPGIPGADFAIRYHPRGRIGGDFYQIIELPFDQVAFIIGDAVGSGLAASFLMASTFTILNRLLLRGLSPREVFTRTNEDLRQVPREPNTFVSVFCGIWNRKSNLFTYSNAGHYAPVLVRSKTLRHVALYGTGFLLGAFDDGKYTEKSMPLERGDRLFFYTDGFVDLINPGGKPPSLFRLYRSVLRNFHLPVRVLMERLMKEFHESLDRDAVPRDDLTFFILEIK